MWVAACYTHFFATSIHHMYESSRGVMLTRFIEFEECFQGNNGQGAQEDGSLDFYSQSVWV